MGKLVKYSPSVFIRKMGDNRLFSCQNLALTLEDAKKRSPDTEGKVLIIFQNKKVEFFMEFSS